MRTRVLLIFCQVSFGLSLLGQGVISVQFDQEEYFLQPSSLAPVVVELGTVIPEGLFSFGVRLVYDPILGGVVNEDAILVPPALDYNGAQGPGALKAFGQGFAAVKGTVDALAFPAVYYGGSELATFNVTALTPGDYAVTLELYRTLGPAENIFVSGAGVTLDSQIRFGTAILHVVPEPAAGLLAMVGLFLTLSGCGMVRRSK
ncbi:MAG: hypothetical protein KJ072_19255 [Verrucomicrobia bacterium]|nr:hypothetical protein [Verrucomicrobiota bacterium]